MESDLTISKGLCISGSSDAVLTEHRISLVEKWASSSHLCVLSLPVSSQGSGW